MRHIRSTLLGALAIAALAPALAHPPAAATGDAAPMHRYLIKRSFPAGALDGLDLATKAKVNATNAKYHVRWVRSYATADKNLTFCVYEAPNEQAIRDAAKANSLPVDEVFEVPVTLMPHSKDLVGR
ncbi:MAG TPA: DUF4242 domain-containing protein [Rhodanobacteraceae bacterium]|nr:DUF4242 domain-containing protein [Rhodanobacteraceae bacterium]